MHIICRLAMRVITTLITVRGDVLPPPHGTCNTIVVANKKIGEQAAKKYNRKLTPKQNNTHTHNTNRPTDDNRLIAKRHTDGQTERQTGPNVDETNTKHG